MSEVQKLILKDKDEEYEVYIAPQEITEVPEEDDDYRDISLPTVDMQKVHKTIRGYAIYAIGAFRNFGAAEVEKITLKFNLKIAGKAGVPMLTEGSAEGNFEIQVECKFPTSSKPSS
jgi:hypothetical protein